jgi:hypothetical protein
MDTGVIILMEVDKDQDYISKDMIKNNKIVWRHLFSYLDCESIERICQSVYMDIMRNKVLFITQPIKMIDYDNNQIVQKCRFIDDQKKMKELMVENRKYYTYTDDYKRMEIQDKMNKIKMDDWIVIDFLPKEDIMKEIVFNDYRSRGNYHLGISKYGIVDGNEEFPPLKDIQKLMVIFCNNYGGHKHMCNIKMKNGRSCECKESNYIKLSNNLLYSRHNGENTQCGWNSINFNDIYVNQLISYQMDYGFDQGDMRYSVRDGLDYKMNVGFCGKHYKEDKHNKNVFIKKYYKDNGYKILKNGYVIKK